MAGAGGGAGLEAMAAKPARERGEVVEVGGHPAMIVPRGACAHPSVDRTTHGARPDQRGGRRHGGMHGADAGRQLEEGGRRSPHFPDMPAALPFDKKYQLPELPRTPRAP